MDIILMSKKIRYVRCLLCGMDVVREFLRWHISGCHTETYYPPLLNSTPDSEKASTYV